MTFSDSFIISNMNELIKAIDELGFVPFFENKIPGFSIEEHIAPGCWYHDSDDGFWPAWEWKGPVIQKMNCAYGKFLKGKAMYVSPKWFPDFANYRRDGYDFDARYEDGLTSYHDKELFELLDANAPIISKQLKKAGNYGKNGKKGFDTMITRLQKQCYVVISDFKYAKDKSGKEYGWGLAEYSTPEIFFGEGFRNTVYKRSPEESYERLVKHFETILPGTELTDIQKILAP
ncbi:MAG: hypothetical protein K6F37_06260 [Lachnospiraceae bacterium]|nr:hypothetical protein [Lachnospiraceae bacterium]